MFIPAFTARKVTEILMTSNFKNNMDSTQIIILEKRKIYFQKLEKFATKLYKNSFSY